MSSRREIRVGDMMAAEVHSIDGLATVADAMAMMRQLGVSSLVVNRRDDNDEVGLILVSDIARHVVAPDRSPDRVNVYEIMSKPVWTLPPNMLARYAVRLLTRVRRVQGGRRGSGPQPHRHCDPAGPGAGENRAGPVSQARPKLS